MEVIKSDKPKKSISGKAAKSYTGWEAFVQDNPKRAK
jgi:hypothetical protein